MQNVTSKYPPTVLIHGDADTDVSWGESEAMDNALTKAHVPHEFISVPGGGHVIGNISQDKRMEDYSRAMTFIKDHQT